MQALLHSHWSDEIMCHFSVILVGGEAHLWLDNKESHVIHISCVYQELLNRWYNGLCIGNVRSHIGIVSNYRAITI